MKTKLLLSAAILTFLICITANAQPVPDQKMIQGTILDASNHEPVPYAHIAVMDDDSLFIGGTSSDPEDHFMLTTLPAWKGLLAVSYVGYNTRWIPLPVTTEKSFPEILL
ncbi:MAG: carboxypeptidase-like regulatory domain-containing protein [Bacteroides sp.]|nr:carboxypeptidase-like regulatory domain-containing protein [Bacteroides sp.]